MLKKARNPLSLGHRFSTLVRPNGEDLLILKTDGDLDMEERRKVNEQFRRWYPSWTGLFLVLHKDQKIERMPENMARDVYKALKARFEPEGVKGEQGGSSEASVEGASGAHVGDRTATHDSVG